jgi:membrane-anchored glycerophosphoryl diester phosphodiesterase (GDPDase)
MEAFSRGWNFLKQAWGMALKDKDLLKPSIYALVVGGLVSLLGIIPIILVAMLAGGSDVGNVIMFVLGAILLFIQFIISYVFSAMTVYLIYGYLSEGDGRMDKAWAIVKRDFFDIATLAAVSTVVNLLKNAANKNKKGIGAAVVRVGAGLLETLWTEAALLILPAMVIDDLNLKKGLERVWGITKSNLLLIGISTVGVKWVTGLIGFALGVIGAVIGFAIGGGAAYVSGGSTAVSVVGIAFGVLIFFLFVVVASVISSYTSTAYHTCLYIWARDVETAKAKGDAGTVAAPAPLAAVL